MVPVPAADALPVGPLAGAGHPGIRPGGTRADRRRAEPDGGAGRPRAPGLQHSAPGDPGGAGPRAGQRGPGLRRDPLVGRALVPARRRGLGRSAASAPAGWTRARRGSPVPRSRRTARFPGSEARRAGTMATLYGACAGCSTLRSAGRDCAGDAGTRTRSPGRHGGLLAGRSGGAGTSAPSGGGDAAAGRAWLQFEVTPEAGGA